MNQLSVFFGESSTHTGESQFVNPSLSVVILLFVLILGSPATLLADPSVSTILDTRAMLIPQQQTILSAELPAKIKQLFVREGSIFKSGQTLLILDCSVHTAKMRKARAALQVAHKKLAVSQRLAQLNAISTVEMEVARAKANEAKEELYIREVILAQCTITAPFDGRVAELSVNQHEYVVAGTTLMEIIDHNNLEMELIIPSLWIKWLTSGTKFSINIDETGKSYPAQVIMLGAKIDPVSQSIKLIGKILGHFPELIPGMSGSVNFPNAP